MSAPHHPRGVVYLLHFTAPYKHTRHYVGFTEDLTQRLAEHRAGRGAKLTAAAAAAGISFVVERTWEQVDRRFERRVHRAKHSPSICPICAGNHAWPYAPHHAAGASARARLH